MSRLPPRYTRTEPTFPYTMLFLPRAAGQPGLRGLVPAGLLADLWPPSPFRGFAGSAARLPSLVPQRLRAGAPLVCSTRHVAGFGAVGSKAVSVAGHIWIGDAAA